MHRAFEIRGNLHSLAPANRANFLDAGHFLGKAHTARAVDAAGHRGLDDRSHIFFGDRALILFVARAALAIGHRLILKIAFAALVADRAVERMVDQEKLHDALARLLDHFAVGADFLPFGSGQRTAGLRLRWPRLHFNQTHPAIAGDAQPLVIAETRDFLAGKLHGLQHSRALRNFDFDAIYGDFRH